MDEFMRNRKAKAEKVIAQEPTFGNKDEALKAAVHQCRNFDSDVTIWEKDGKYALVQFENREEAGLAEYKEVYSLGEIFDKVKEQKGIEDIDEV